MSIKIWSGSIRRSNRHVTTLPPRALRHNALPIQPIPTPLEVRRRGAPSLLITSRHTRESVS